MTLNLGSNLPSHNHTMSCPECQMRGLCDDQLYEGLGVEDPGRVLQCLMLLGLGSLAFTGPFLVGSITQLDFT